MKKKHSFNFDGGNILARMGASWFVSYTYYLIIDINHMNWRFCDTVKMRHCFFSSSYKYHNCWLNKILQMNPKKLTSNLLCLKGEEVINMANKIIQKKNLFR